MVLGLEPTCFENKPAGSNPETGIGSGIIFSRAVEGRATDTFLLQMSIFYVTGTILVNTNAHHFGEAGRKCSPAGCTYIYFLFYPR